MESAEIRRRFIDFFVKRGHVEIPSSSLIPPEVSATQKTLFNSAGMQPLIPYLLGKEHPKGKRLVDIQKCIRTGDIDDVGDNRHLTFFEMLGNWSLGDYFKEDAIKWSVELLTSKEEGFGLDLNRLYITCFEGDKNAPKDTESADIWMKNGIAENRIYFLGAEDNFWSAGDDGPCGPDTEMFYDLTENGLGDLSKEEFLKAIKDETVVEIWNDVFMEYEKKDGKVIGKLANKNVDTGAGLERLTSVMQGKKTAYDTDLFAPLLLILREFDSSGGRSPRIIADHMRASVFLINDGVIPSNTDSGYVLRRLLRRAYVHTKKIGAGLEDLLSIANIIMGHSAYKNSYEFNPEKTKDVIREEITRFEITIKEGLKEFEKGVDPFILFTTYGFPFELTKELAKEKGREIDEKDFQEKFKSHQDLSRAGAEQKFKGGLAGHSEKEIQSLA